MLRLPGSRWWSDVGHAGPEGSLAFDTDAMPDYLLPHTSPAGFHEFGGRGAGEGPAPTEEVGGVPNATQLAVSRKRGQGSAVELSAGWFQWPPSAMGARDGVLSGGPLCRICWRPWATGASLPARARPHLFAPGRHELPRGSQAARWRCTTSTRRTGWRRA